MNARKHVDGFRLPDNGDLTENEWAWVGFIRVIAGNSDPAPSLVAVQALRRALAPP